MTLSTLRFCSGYGRVNTDKKDIGITNSTTKEKEKESTQEYL